MEPGERSSIFLLTLTNVLENEQVKLAKVLQKTLVDLMDQILEGLGFGARITTKYTELDDVEDAFVLDGAGKRKVISCIKDAVRGGCPDLQTFIEIFVEYSNREREKGNSSLSEAGFNERMRATVEYIESIWDELVAAVAAEDEEEERREEIRKQVAEEKQRLREERKRQAREEREREEAAAAAKAKAEEEKRLLNDQIERARHKLEKNLRNILTQQQREAEKQAIQREWLEKHPRKNGN
jgi:flagellar biosynthesis GTPase FlhF